MSVSAHPPSAPPQRASGPEVGSWIEVLCIATRQRRELRIDAMIGTGGMSNVYSATDREGVRTALKIMKREMAEDPRVRARFLREKAIVDRVDHPARVPIHVAGTTSTGEPVLMMELVDGESVETVRRRLGGRLPLAAALRVVDEVLELLVACHAVGVLHRDVKTTNLLLENRRVRVVDFGIAHCPAIDEEGGAIADMTLGTPSFMAPEQAAGLSGDVDARADVFSAGAVLFTLLTGRRLHRGRTHDESLFLAATQAAPALLEVDDGFDDAIAALVDRALAFDREHRFPDAASMRDALQRLRMQIEARLTLTGLPTAAADETPGPAVSSGSIPVRAPDAKGTLEATPLPNLLTYILTRALDGTLIVSASDAREMVEFQGGAPVRRGTTVDADPLVGALFRITRMPETASYRFYIEERDLPAQRIEPLDAILTTARRLRHAPTFVARMRHTLERLGARPIALHPHATPQRFGLSTLEKELLDRAIDLRLSYGGLLAAEIAPRDVVDPLVYTLGITRHLDVGVANAWPAGVVR